MSEYKTYKDVATMLQMQEMMETDPNELARSAKETYKIYTAYKNAGFTPNQAFNLVKELVIESLRAARK